MTKERLYYSIGTVFCEHPISPGLIPKQNIKVCFLSIYWVKRRVLCLNNEKNEIIEQKEATFKTCVSKKLFMNLTEQDLACYMHCA